MTDRARVITAEELDAMTPDQRAAAIVRDSVVTDWDDVPAEFRRKVEATGKQVGSRPSDPDWWR